MRKIPLIVLFVAACFASTISCTKAEPVTTRVVVEGMHCQSCADAIIDALEGIDGVNSATSDFSNGVTTATHDPKHVSGDVIKTTIEDLGYTAIITSPKDG